MDPSYKELQISGSDWSYGSRWGDQMEESINEIFSGYPNNERYNILDVGCGEGRGLMALYDIGFSQRSIIGVDIAPDKIKAARERGFLVLDEDFHKLTSIPDNYFNYVYSSHTLEHSYDLEAAFKSIMRVCKGTFFFIVPVGETKEEVDKYNPSHTSPIKDEEQLVNILDKIGYKYKIQKVERMCPEIWGEVWKS